MNRSACTTMFNTKSSVFPTHYIYIYIYIYILIYTSIYLLRQHFLPWPGQKRIISCICRHGACFSWKLGFSPMHRRNNKSTWGLYPIWNMTTRHSVASFRRFEDTAFSWKSAIRSASATYGTRRFVLSFISNFPHNSTWMITKYIYICTA